MTSALEAPMRLLQLHTVSKKLFEIRNVKIHTIMRICNRYYENENVEECLKSFDEIQELLQRNTDYDELTNLKYNKAMLFPFHITCPFRHVDFSTYNFANNRMGTQLDWQTGHGTIIDLIQRVLLDLDNENFREIKNTELQKKRIRELFIRFELGEPTYSYNLDS